MWYNGGRRLSFSGLGAVADTGTLPGSGSFFLSEITSAK